MGDGGVVGGVRFAVGFSGKARIIVYGNTDKGCRKDRFAVFIA